MGPGPLRSMLLAAGAALLTLTACAGPDVVAGSVSLDLPDGWRVADRGGTQVQLTGEGGRVVVDLYLDSPVTPQSHRETLRGAGVAWTEEQLTLDGESAVLFRPTDPAPAGPRVTVVIPSDRVLVVYRTAPGASPEAFDRSFGSFRDVLGSIRLAGEPPA